MKKFNRVCALALVCVMMCGMLLTGCGKDADVKDTASDAAIASVADDATEKINEVKDDIDKVIEDGLKDAASDDGSEPSQAVASVENLFRNYWNKANDGVKMGGSMDFDIAVSVFGEEESMRMTGGFMSTANKDASYTFMRMYGYEDEVTLGEPQISETYVVRENDDLVAYINENGVWTKQTTGVKDNKLFENLFPAEMMDRFVVEENDEYYVVTGTIDLAEAMSLVGDAVDIEDLTEDMSGIDMTNMAAAKVEYLFNKEDWTLANITVNMTETMQDLFDRVVKAMFESEEFVGMLGEEASLSEDDMAALMSMFTFKVNACVISITDIEFDSGLEVVVPAEVIEAVAEMPAVIEDTEGTEIDG